MKKISTLALCLMLLLTLTACAAIGRYAGKTAGQQAAESANPVPTLAPAESEVPQQTPGETTEATPALPAVSPEELGNAPSNLSAGGAMVRGEDGALYLAQEDGIYALPEGGSLTKISPDRAASLNFYGGRLYYIAQTYAPDETGYVQRSAAEIASLAPDGSDRQVLAEQKPAGTTTVFDAQTGFFTEWTQRVGYGDLCIAQGYAFFLADNERPGTVRARDSVSGREGESGYASEKSIYRIDLATGERQEIVADVGAAQPHLATDGVKLYYTTSYENPFFAYPFVTFHACGLDGSGDELLLPQDYNPNAACGFTSDRGCMTEIIDGIFPANGALFVEASDSEGDFPNSRLMCVAAGAYQKVADETYYVRTVDAGEGRMVFFTAPGGVQYEQDEEGVITNEYVQDARLILGDPGEGEGETLLTIERVNRFGDEFSRFDLAVFGSDLYLRTDRALYRVDAGGSEKLADLPTA